MGMHFYITRPSLCSGANNSTILADLTADVLEDSTTNVPCNVEYAPLAIVSITTFNLALSTGWGTIPWILVAELTPLQVRGIATGGHRCQLGHFIYRRWILRAICGSSACVVCMVVVYGAQYSRSCVYDCLPSRDEGKDTGRH